VDSSVPEGGGVPEGSGVPIALRSVALSMADCRGVVFTAVPAVNPEVFPSAAPLELRRP
jgi:hypothetical protein